MSMRHSVKIISGNPRVEYSNVLEFYIRVINLYQLPSSFWPGRFYFQKEKNGEGDLITKPDDIL